MKKYLKPEMKNLGIIDIITASDEPADVTKGVAKTDASQSVNFDDSILDPVGGDAGSRLAGLFPSDV